MPIVHGQMTWDAPQAALGFVVAQAAHIESEVNRTVYPEIQYPGLIPVDTSAHPFTQTVLYYSSDVVGKARWINGNADDIPLVNSEMDSYKTSVYTAGIGYGFGWEEVNVAMLMGTNLQSQDAQTARRAYEEFIDNVALRGDADKGFSGLINYPGITTIASPSTPTWVTATVDEIMNDINTLLLGTPNATLWTTFADTMLISPGRYSIIATRRLGDTQMTLLQWIQQANAYTAQTGRPLTIRAVRGLETAGGGSTERAVAYRRSPDVLKLHIPMPHRFLPLYQDGPLHWVVPGVFRLGGVDVRRPLEMRYMDGI